MCGIAGFSHMTEVTRKMAPFLMWEMEHRGHDSWGATNGTDIVKVLGPITETFEDYREEIAGWSRAIYHTRGASTGTITVDNQHPFVFHSGEPGTPSWNRTVCGIHNGIVSNHFSLNTKYSRGFTVDSMHIYKNLCDRLSTSEIQGYGNLAWYEFTPMYPEGILYLLRFNNDALHIAQLETGEFVFCSTKDPIERAARMAGSAVHKFFTTTEEHVYYIKFTDGVPSLYKGAKLPFGTRTSYQSNANSEWWEGRNAIGGVRRNSSVNSARAAAHRHDVVMASCCVVGCHDKVMSGSRKTSILCAKHWEEVVVAQAAERAAEARETARLAVVVGG